MGLLGRCYQQARNDNGSRKRVTGSGRNSEHKIHIDRRALLLGGCRLVSESCIDGVCSNGSCYATDLPGQMRQQAGDEYHILTCSTV
jgi:hypothetical protein